MNELKNLTLGIEEEYQIIDPDSKTDVSDDIVGHVFLVIAIILIFRL